MANPKLNVLIAGAGIAGPCLAYWLSRTSLDANITIVERSPTPRVTGQAIDIRGPAIGVMKDMHLEEAIRARHTTEEGTRFIGPSGKNFATFEADGSDNSFTAEYEILRADLSELILQTTEDLKGVRYVYGDYVETLEQTEKDVKVTFARGSIETFDLVVAADGSTSRTRSLILDETVLKDSYRFIGQYLAFFSVPSLPTDPKMWQWFNAPKGRGLMLRPHRNTATQGAYLIITTPARGQRDPILEDVMDKGMEEKKHVLHEYLDDAGWEAKRILKAMDHAEDFYMSRAAQVKLPKWVNGRALVLGDAAFATFGVGTSLAIESAYVLAGELSKIKGSEDIPEALQRYEDIYKPLVDKVGDLPSIFPQCAFPQTAWGLWLRDCLLWFVSKTKLYKLLQGGSETDYKLPTYDWVDLRKS